MHACLQHCFWATFICVGVPVASSYVKFIWDQIWLFLAKLTKMAFLAPARLLLRNFHTRGSTEARVLSLAADVSADGQLELLAVSKCCGAVLVEQGKSVPDFHTTRTGATGAGGTVGPPSAGAC